MSTDEPNENPTDLPESHPLAGYNGVLDDHEAHVDAIREYLEETDADHIRSMMFVITTEDDETDTIPTMKEGADFESCVWFQLAAHISHVANAFGAPPEQVAKHACHVLRDQQRPPEEYRE